MKQSLLSFAKSARPLGQIPTVEISDDESIDTPPSTCRQANRHTDTSGPSLKRAASPLSSDKVKKSSGLAQDARWQKLTTFDDQHCHHHKKASNGALLWCTVRKPDGKRCNNRFCEDCLEHEYGQSISVILLRGKSEEHRLGKIHVIEPDYVWTCPSCRDRCQCFECISETKINPITSDPAPSGAGPTNVEENAWFDHGQNSKDALPSSMNQRKRLDVDKGEAKRQKKEASPQELQGRKRAQALQPTILNGFAKAAQRTHDPSQPLRSHPAPSNLTTASVPVIAKAKQPLKQSVMLTAPKVVPAPALRPAETRLPLPNILERIWLYESLVRFDAFDIPKRSVLQKLEQFNLWTEGQVHTILTRLTLRLAEIKNLQQATQIKTYVPLLTALRTVGTNLQRGEAWEAARLLCEQNKVCLSQLEDVELLPEQMMSSGGGDDSIASNTDPTDTLLNNRASRSRRAANTAAQAKVKSIVDQVLLDEESDESDDEGESGTDESDSEGGNYDQGSLFHKPSSTSRTQEMIVLLDNDPGTDESEEENDQTKSFPARRSTRRAAIESKKASGDTDKRRNSVEGVDAQKNQEASVSKVVLIEPEHLPVPPFERRIAILTGMVLLLLQTSSIRKELEDSVPHMKEREKQGKEEEREMLKAQAEEMRELKSKQMDMHRIGKGSEWKEEYEKLTKEHAFAIIDLHIDVHLFCDAHKPRSGPLGRDVDGNEYWQLSEFNEKMPEETDGHWAWSLLVIGRTCSVPNRTTVGLEVEAGAIEDKERRVFCVNDVEEIKKLRAYLRFRLEMKEYEGSLMEREKDDEVAREIFLLQQAADSDTLRQDDELHSSGSQPQGQKEDARKIQNLRQRRSYDRKSIQSAQQVLRAEVDQLLRRLLLVQEYYDWHTSSAGSR